jgi:SpoVK/Ycf46/Vps4 family AAA+-type ATPase
LSSVDDLDIELSHPWVEEAAVTMADYGGRPELCQTIENTVIVPFRDHPEQAKQLGVPVPSLLLYGPPGTGKTYLAEALAGEIGYPYVTLSGGDMLSRYVNASTENVNELFTEARAIAEQAGGALIFIDEIDSVLKNRQASNQHAEDRKVVNEFLTQIEKVGEENILFIGATNVHEELDTAALSRFDMELFVDLPDEQTRRDIITAQLTNRAHSVTASQIEEMAAVTEEYSARDLTKIVTDAARRTLIQPDRDEITGEECHNAIAEFSE